MQNKKGFTLIEVLLIILLLGILATSALTSYFNSAKTFNFLEAYKSVMTPIRTARGYAVANKDGGTILKYGVRIDNDCVNFLEMKAGDYAFHLEKPEYSHCKPTEDDDDLMPDFVNTNKSVYFENGDYEISVPNSNISLDGAPIYIFYETGTGNLTAFSGANQDPVSKASADGKAIWFAIKDMKDPDLEQHIVVLTVSGLAEEADLPVVDEVVEIP